MKQVITVGCTAVFVGVLLATVTSVYANHAAIGKGTYAVAPQAVAAFHFVVAKQLPNSDLKPGLNFVQADMAEIDGPIPFRISMVSTHLDFTIPLESAENDERTVTIKGELVSTTFLVVEGERQSFAELVAFTAIGVDKKTPEAGADLFSLVVEYSASQAQGPLFESLGFGKCYSSLCTIKFTGPVKKGDIFVHTAGSD